MFAPMGAWKQASVRVASASITQLFDSDRLDLRSLGTDLERPRRSTLGPRPDACQGARPAVDSRARREQQRASHTLRMVTNPAGSIEEFRAKLLEALPRLRGFALSYCGAKADADDAVQLACERALGHWQQWSGHGAFDHWLIKILVNAWRDELRSRKVRAGPELDSLPEPATRDADAAEHVYLEQVQTAITRLPEAQREVLVLVAAEGMSYQETADMLGIPIGTVMSRLCRARRALIERFGIGND
jgi:RNA polymerase sigma-70 factor, ECF subfamily